MSSLTRNPIAANTYRVSFADIEIKTMVTKEAGHVKGWIESIRSEHDGTPTMASTPAAVKELPAAYIFVVDMLGIGSGEMKVQVEDDNVLVISGERKRKEDNEEGKYLKMERRMGKLMRKFTLPENANMEAILAVCKDGVLTVTVEKLPPPEPKSIEVKIA